MPFPLPEAVQRVPELEATRVRFDDQTVGEYYVRGGICFPSVLVAGQRSEVKGFIVLCAVNIRTGRCCVFGAEPFNAVSNVVREDIRPATKIQPLAPILNRWWGGWFCDTFYWHDRGETHSAFRTQVNRDDAIQPKPRLAQIEWDDDAAAEQVYWTAATTGCLAMEKQVADAVAEKPAGEFCPARHALVCALVGIQRRPWRLPENRRENENVFGVNLWRGV